MKCLHMPFAYIFIGELCKTFIDLIYVFDSFARALFFLFVFALCVFATAGNSARYQIPNLQCVSFVFESVMHIFIHKYIHFNINIFCHLQTEYLFNRQTSHSGKTLIYVKKFVFFCVCLRILSSKWFLCESGFMNFRLTSFAHLINEYEKWAFFS